MQHGVCLLQAVHVYVVHTAQPAALTLSLCTQHIINVTARWAYGMGSGRLVGNDPVRTHADTLGQVPVATEAAAAPPAAHDIPEHACTNAAGIVSRAVLDAGLASRVDPEPAAPPTAPNRLKHPCTNAAYIVARFALDAGLASRVDPEPAAPEESPALPEGLATPKASLAALAPPSLDALVGTSIFGFGPRLQTASPMPCFKHRAG